METLKFNVVIHAPKQRVWKVLWSDTTLRQWAGIIDPGTYMVGELSEGKEVQFLSNSGYGVTSLVAQLHQNTFILFKHKADTQHDGSQSREDQWTGGEESYRLEDQSDGRTQLVLTFDAPSELVSIMKTSYPKALQRIKQLAEAE